MKNPYQTLGVGKKATPEQIKKAYRRLALLHHPDRGGSDEKFKDIAEAYALLSDPQKRKEFDRRAAGFNPLHEAIRQAARQKRKQAEEFKRRKKEQLFQDIWQKYKKRTHIPSDAEIRFKVDVSLDQIKKGAKQRIAFNRQVSCGDCDGKGGTNFSHCPVCRGTGYEINNDLKLPCLTCQMRGTTPKDVCKSCKGIGLKKERQEYIFEIKESK